MAFPVGWNRCCELQVDYTKVDTAAQTDFPVLLTLANLPSEMFDADGSFPAINGGGDIRFTSDRAGATQLSCEIVSFVTNNTPANGSAEIWVKKTVSNTVNTKIYVWYNGPAGSTQPAVNDTYGRNDVWSNSYKAVWHLGETDGTASMDSGGGNHNFIYYGTTLPNPATGQIGNGQDLDASSGDYMFADQTNFQLANNFTVSAWARWDSPGTAYDCLLMKDSCYGLQRVATNVPPTMGFTIAASDGNEYIDNGMALNADSNMHYHVGSKATSEAGKIYYDGTLKTTGTKTGTVAISNTPMEIGHSSASTFGWNGIADEARISTVARSAGWIKTEYNSQYSPSTFIITGNPQFSISSRSPGAVFQDPCII